MILFAANDVPSTFHPHGAPAGSSNHLWWMLFWIAVVVCIAVFTVLVIAIVKGKRNQQPVRDRGDGEKGVPYVLTFGAIFPAIVLLALFITTAQTLRTMDARAAATQDSISVTGHQFWWEVRYPTANGTVVTANEIHIPTQTRMRVDLTSADVNHSFWVPQLSPKMDLIPGQTNHLWLDADKPGTYRGQCAEFCGLQHAHMAFTVVAQPPAEYQQWLDSQQATAQEPTTPDAIAGQQVFMTNPCVTCHTISGTKAQGVRGPDLSHVASRNTLAAGEITNDPQHLQDWIQHAQDIKTGSLMPNIEMSDEQAREITAYLEGLK